LEVVSGPGVSSKGSPVSEAARGREVIDDSFFRLMLRLLLL
jgi:hypothetical protein